MDQYIGYTLLGVQGVVSLATFAFCLYRINRNRRVCDDRARCYDFYSPINPKSVRSDDEIGSKSSVTHVALPKRRKIAKTSGDAALDNLKKMLEKTTDFVPKELRRVIETSVEENKFTSEQCISALSYEFVGVYGSEKIQQADVELFATIFAESINPGYSGYVDFILLLRQLDEFLVKAFDPKLMLLGSLLVTSHQSRHIDDKSMLEEMEANGLEMIKVMAAVTAISIYAGSAWIGEEDVYDAMETIRAAIVRRSSRIRKIKN